MGGGFDVGPLTARCLASSVIVAIASSWLEDVGLGGDDDIGSEVAVEAD